MNIVITESQHRMLVEQQSLKNALNGVKFINGLIIIVGALARAYNSALGKNIKNELELLQSLLKQSLAGGRTDLSESEMNIIRNQTKTILNKVSVSLGFENWSQFKEQKYKNIINKYGK